MRKITEVTRRDVMDIITDGFVVRELSDDSVDCNDIETDKMGRYKIRICHQQILALGMRMEILFNIQ